MPALLTGEHSMGTRRMSRTTQIMTEEKEIAPGSVLKLPESSLVRDSIITEVRTAPTTPDIKSSTLQVQDPEDGRLTGIIASWRGSTILATACFAQLLDNTWMSAINIAVPKITEEFSLSGGKHVPWGNFIVSLSDAWTGSQSWLLSAYTLTFGGFLLLSGVLSDRFGRRLLFSGGMLWMATFSIACGVSNNGVQCIIFRAMQGLGAASSVPSAIGVLSSYFTGNERHRALSMFGAAGALGVILGLILGGILSGTLGWRYIFYINAPIILILSVSGWLSFPKDVRNTGRQASLDFLGAGLGTSGIILMTFALSQSEVDGWGKPLVLVTLITSAFVLLAFAWAERKVR
ncbi:hypothetical protein VKT23_008581 [Stygiomarasmius scandens]|uniref:Major facilitator superfamily (MFS) profile domain-containing protein n=1 Tax=Marasmiellus scandens TaxID=2682957 RepID=A0ABR1JJM6_9AGAR